MNLKELIRSKIARNAGWLIGGKIVHALLSFLVGILTARYLGPERHGLINYVTAYTTFFFSLCTLGLDSVLVKALVDDPECEGSAIGTALVMRGISSLLSAGMIVGIVSMVDKGDRLVAVIAALCSLGLLFRVFETFNYWFQAHLQSKYSAIAATVAYIAASAYRIVLLATGKSVQWFALATSVDYAVVGVVLLVAYKRRRGPKLSFSMQKARQLLGKSRHYILAGLMVSIYGSTDRLMLKHMLDESAVSFYSTAVSLCNVWVFVLTALIDSMSPPIMKAYRQDAAQFRKYNRFLYGMVFYAAMAVSVMYVLFGGFAIGILYGEAYLPAAAPLRVITWYVAFSYLGVARNAWIVCENQQKYLVWIYVGAAFMNVVLNLLLIPMWGTVGAALASLLTQISTILIFPCMIPGLRPNACLMLQAISLKDLREKH